MDHQDFVDVPDELRHAQQQMLCRKKPWLMMSIQPRRLILGRQKLTNTMTTFISLLLLKKLLNIPNLFITINYQLNKLFTGIFVHQMFQTHFVLIEITKQLQMLIDEMFPLCNPTTRISLSLTV